MTTSRRPRKIAARTVTTTDGARAYLPAVTLVDASAVTPCYCAGCSRRIEARGALVISSRDVDLNAAFDVTYCSRTCRASTVGDAL